ncbi:hypothetical protein IWX90DRAFT_148018 [Phyllosticta citrichinensis]|uniref:Uncharacterized protein n=1 Tax=Phyllosticta citrichinensis TaxID=1130410 RepID=A0ABR1XZA1_9PEZI
MCVAELNVSLLPCRHRWYHLLRPCSPTSNLSNCKNKLGLEGWETKCDYCPYCSTWNLSSTEYRLVGNDRSPSVGGLSRSPSISYSSTTTLTSARRDSRRASLARTDSSSSIAMPSVSVLERTGERNRAITARLDAYLGKHPDRKESKSGGETSDEDEQSSTQPPSPVEGDVMSRVDAQVAGAPLKRRDSILKKGWRSSKRLSRTIFK